MAIVISKLSFNVFPIVKFIQLIDIRTTQKLVASNLGFYFHAYIQCFIHTVHETGFLVCVNQLFHSGQKLCLKAHH